MASVERALLIALIVMAAVVAARLVAQVAAPPERAEVAEAACRIARAALR